MKYDFDKIKDRRGRFACKWDVGEGELPMWIADMDFESPEPVRRALADIAEHGVYGYVDTPPEYFEAVAGYFNRRYNAGFAPSEMVFVSGVVAAIGSMVRRLTVPGECVLIQAPVYNCFYNCILNSGRSVLSSDLVYEDGKYAIDFEDLEEKLSRPSTSLMILCNPHNPVGKIWSREELARIGELCKKHSVAVISDEIHCDFTAPGLKYVPFHSVSDTCADISVTCVSGSKTFNVAGLHAATLIIKDGDLRYKIWRAINTEDLGEPGVFAIQSTIAAFSECDDWVDALREYVFENRRVACDYINERIGSLKPIAAEATYLLWVDVSEVTDRSDEFTKKLRELTGLYISAGTAYGKCGGRFVRINLATQRARLLDGLERLRVGVEKITSEK